MALSSIAICSRALLKLGADTIASFDEGTAEAEVAANLYPSVRDALLSAHPWSFATAQVTLAKLAAVPVADFEAAFQLPADFLRALSAGPEGRGRGMDYRIAERRLYCNADPIVLTYTLATEDNIAADVATARTGWSDYVDILKNRDATETFAWRFSHDSSNEHATSSTGTYQATRALSGSNNWVGWSIRIGSAYGTAAGSDSHTNGVATTVTHNLGNARGIIALFNRSNGEVAFYHPDLSSGKLLELTGTGAETTDSAITNVGANSFDIGSGEATATYDYLVIVATPGLWAMGKFAGNGNADGAFAWAGGLPYWFFAKTISNAEDWLIWDGARSPFNPADKTFQWQAAGAESTSNRPNDFIATGVKCRSTSANDWNASGNDYAWFAALKHPFGGSGAAQARAR